MVLVVTSIQGVATKYRVSQTLGKLTMSPFFFFFLLGTIRVEKSSKLFFFSNFREISVYGPSQTKLMCVN